MPSGFLGETIVLDRPKLDEEELVLLQKVTKALSQIPKTPVFLKATAAQNQTEEQVLPKRCNLREKYQWWYARKQIGPTCTGEAVAAALHFLMHKHCKAVDLSPHYLFLKMKEHQCPQNVGSAALMAREHGACLKNDAIAIEKFTDHPKYCRSVFWKELFQSAQWKQLTSLSKQKDRTPVVDQIISFATPRNASQADDFLLALKTSVGLFDIPILFGLDTYKSWYRMKNFTLPVPQLLQDERVDVDAEDLDGGHAMLIVGYDNEHVCRQTLRSGKVHTSRGAFLVLNSWGPAWGVFQGCLWIPYEYFTMVCVDSRLRSTPASLIHDTVHAISAFTAQQQSFETPLFSNPLLLSNKAYVAAATQRPKARSVQPVEEPRWFEAQQSMQVFQDILLNHFGVQTNL